MIEGRLVCDVGWEMIKIYQKLFAYLWLAELGWQGGYAVSAEPHPEGVSVTTSPRFDPLVLALTGASMN